MKILDLFAGAGGWDVAAQQLGHDVAGVENMREAVATREANGLATLFDDVWAPFAKNEGMPWRQDPAYAARKAMFDFGPDALIASPPCQTFSLAGRGAGRAALDDVLQAFEHYETAWRQFSQDPEQTLTSMILETAEELRRYVAGRGMDERTALVLTPLLYVDWLLPEVILLEQVPSVLPVWAEYAKHLERRGYSVAVGHAQAEQFGVPQTRRRAVLLARRDGKEARLPQPTHSRYHNRTPERLDADVLPWVSMAEALGWKAEECEGWVAGKAMGSGMVERYGDRPDRELDKPAFTIRASAGGMEPGGFRWVEVVPGRDPEWVFNRPSPTVVGSFAPEVIAAPGYRKAGDGPRQSQPGSVKVTLQEAAVLQSFPRDFVVCGPKGKQFLQVGNAVPPLLARALIEEVTS